MVKPEIVIFDTDAAVIAALQGELNLPFVRTAVGNGIQVTRSAQLDGMWLTPMQAERYGASPPFPLHEAQILVTPHGEVEKGFPEVVIVGVALSADDPTDPQWQLRLVISAMLKAISDADRLGTFHVERVGMLPEHLMLNRLPLRVAAAIIDKAYRQQYPLSESTE